MAEHATPLHPNTANASPEAAPNSQDTGTRSKPPRPSLKGPLRLGALIAGAFVLVFAIWGLSAPLSGGAVAPGVVAPDGSARTVQHQEGGIIAGIFARDGDRVERGDVLIELDDTQARATFVVATQRARFAEARLARLQAERDGAYAIDFPPSLIERRGDRELQALVADQIKVFERRREAMDRQKALINEQIVQLRAEIAGLDGQIRSTRDQMALLSEEIDDTQTLYDRGLSAKPRLMALKREEARIRGERDAATAQRARANGRIAELEIELVALDNRFQEEVAQAISEVRAELAGLNTQAEAAMDVLDRTEILAPISGTVVRSQFRTLGGVISPGVPILDIVPADEDLVIRAQVSPQDVDNVAVGQEAQVTFSAFSQRNVKPMRGVVQEISADAITDERTGVSYFDARVMVTPEELAKLGPDASLTPGMPAEVIIVTGERTLWEYITDPFTDVFRRGMREQ